MATPDIQLNTLFVLNSDGRIAFTREPAASRGPLFALIRGKTSCAWAVREDLPPHVAREIERLARQEYPTADFRAAPVHADEYAALLSERVGSTYSGPAFTFPAFVKPAGDLAVIEDESVLGPHFRGWVPGEIAAGRAPVVAIFEDGSPVSICFCARRSKLAAEAGLETAAAYRRRGFGWRVASAWARALRTSGLTPLYSTSWTNPGSLAVARKLGLSCYASNWSVSD